MSSVLNSTSSEMVDDLLVIVNKIRVILIAAKDYYENAASAEVDAKYQESIFGGNHDDSLEEVMADKKEAVVEDNDVFVEVKSGNVELPFPSLCDFPTSIVKPVRRVSPAKRARITDSIEEGIIDALFNRDPSPRMQDVAQEFGCSQSTVSRIKRNHEEASRVSGSGGNAVGE